MKSDGVAKVIFFSSLRVRMEDDYIEAGLDSVWPHSSTNTVEQATKKSIQFFDQTQCNPMACDIGIFWRNMREILC